MDERKRFVLEAVRSLTSRAELCRRYGISRKTGYKWLKRWTTEGSEGLQDHQSRTPIAAGNLTGSRGRDPGGA